MGEPETWTEADWRKVSLAWSASKLPCASECAEFARRKAENDPELAGVYHIKISKVN